MAINVSNGKFKLVGSVAQLPDALHNFKISPNVFVTQLRNVTYCAPETGGAEYLKRAHALHKRVATSSRRQDVQ